MKIGQLAEQVGLSTKAIRYYENIGILPEPKRAPNGYRSYPPSTAELIAFIRDAQTAGLALEEIQTILDLRDRGQSTCNHVIEFLQARVEEVDRQMDDLKRTRRRLAEIVDQARSMDPADCNDPNRCQTIPKESHDH